ncbi:MAG: M20 family metallopeptidase [Eubacteriales bacterium]|nr:M20 family metallopeptidase [Eubacteriales bacterium]
MDKLDQKIAEIKDELIELRKALHRFPEAGFKEYKTAEKVATYMQNLGLEVQTGVGGTGIVGLLRGQKEGATIAIRACLDALEMEECSGVDYISENKGVFHGCGHDGNMVLVLGAAKILSQFKDELKGNVKFIFQPSEEETGGAAAMIQAEVLKNPDIDAIFHIHNWHNIKECVLGVRPGPVLASSDVFNIEIIGKPGHGAWPHMAVDPIVIAAEVISSIQNIISREIDPMKPALITIGKINGGTAVNIIPEKVTIDGTVRAYHQDVREQIAARLEGIVKGITQATGATYKLAYHWIMPPANNDLPLTAKVNDILKNSFEQGMVTDDIPCEMGCEEFALFQQEIPGLFIFLGKDKEGERIVPLHDPEYIFNDETITTGVKALCEIAFKFNDRRK